jgi:SAM-dependent methyltransferase
MNTGPTAPGATPHRSAQFVDRSRCIACASTRLNELSSGAFDEGAVGDFLRADPWGEDPMPFLAGARWRYVRCADCGQAFHLHVLDAEWSERRFSRWMSQEAIESFERRSRTPQGLLDRAAGMTAHVLRLEALTRARRDGAVRLLDFGCGHGEFVALCNLYGFQAVGVDRSPARRRHALVPIVGDLDAVTGPFDAVTLFEVLEHLDRPREMLERLALLLRPGAVLVLETPNCEGVTGIRTYDDYLKIHPLEHINGFTPDTLRQIAQRVGFDPIAKPVAHVTMDPLRVAKTEARRLLGRLLAPTTQQYFRKR